MKFNPNRYDLILLFAVVSGIYYVIDETLNNAPPRRTAETLPVVFSVDASPQTAAGLVQGLIKSNQWCHVPVGARQAWDFALVDTELNGEDATAVYRLRPTSRREAPQYPDAARAGASETVRERGRTEEMGARRRRRGVAPRGTS